MIESVLSSQLYVSQVPKSSGLIVVFFNETEYMYLLILSPSISTFAGGWALSFCLVADTHLKMHSNKA